MTNRFATSPGESHIQGLGHNLESNCYVDPTGQRKRDLSHTWIRADGNSQGTATFTSSGLRIEKQSLGLQV
jgi:hypothetical protein